MRFQSLIVWVSLDGNGPGLGHYLKRWSNCKGSCFALRHYQLWKRLISKMGSILSIPNLFKKRSDDKPNNDTIMVTRISCRSISRQLCWSSWVARRLHCKKMPNQTKSQPPSHPPPLEQWNASFNPSSSNPWNATHHTSLMLAVVRMTSLWRRYVPKR